MKKAKKIVINIIVLSMLSVSILLTFALFFVKPNASPDGYFSAEGVKYYKEEGICPVCHEELIKYCYGKDCPCFVWSCPNDCENK